MAKVLVSLILQENASREFSREDVFGLIDEKKEAGWTFVFLGADQDAWIAGESLGIDRGNTLSYASSDTRRVLAMARRATQEFLRRDGQQTGAFWEQSREGAKDEDPLLDS